MKKTCENCAFFHSRLRDDKTAFHIHNYCECYNRTETAPMHSKINDFLNEYWDNIPEDSSNGVFDDIETGTAACYRFYPNKKSQDKVLKANFESNKKLALITIDHILETGKVYDLTGELVDIDEISMRDEFEKTKKEISSINFED